MAEIANTTEKAPKKSWFKGLKSEFKKISWPKKEDVAKQSVAVVIVTVLLSIIIAIVDACIKYGVEFLIK